VEILESSKFFNAIDTALDGKQAVDLLSTKTYDFFLLDLNMPKLRGDDVAETLKESGQLMGDRIIVISGFLDDEAVEQMRSFGITNTIEKPFTKDELLEKIRSLLGN
jgi:CheY-like chemotaxis protein